MLTVRETAVEEIPTFQKEEDLVDSSNTHLIRRKVSTRLFCLSDDLVIAISKLGIYKRDSRQEKIMGYKDFTIG